MIRIINLSEEQKQELGKMAREERGCVVLRALLVLWACRDQQTPEEIAKRVGWKVKRVRKWLKRFLKEGPAGLYDLPRSGRTSKANPFILNQIATRLDEGHPPEQTHHCIWTIGLIVSYIAACFTVQVHPDTVRRWVHKLNFRWRRPKREPGPTNDPRAEEKVTRINQVCQTRGPQDTVLYGDESSVYLLPLLRAMWSRLAQQTKILTYSGWNKSIKIFGAVNAFTGQLTYQIHNRCNSQSFISLLEDMLTVYPQGTIYLIVDCAKYHTSAMIKQWLAEHTRMQILLLPTASPRLNPIEKVWWYAKPRISANKWHGSIEALKNKTIEVLNSITPKKMMELARLAA